MLIKMLHVYAVIMIFVCQEVSQVETELKTRAAAYNVVKGSLQSLQHKQG